MNPLVRSAVIIIVATLLTSCTEQESFDPSPLSDNSSEASDTATRQLAELTAPPADHHVHVWSASSVELFRAMQQETGQTVMPDDQLKPLSAGDVVQALDDAGIQQAVVLSTAYFFASPLISPIMNPALDADAEYAKVRAENDFVAGEIAKHPDRLLGFFSVNPVSDWAISEIERLALAPEFTGLKIHLANSGFDFRDSSHVRRLAEVFRAANQQSIPIIIHLYNGQEDYGGADAEIFIDEVLPMAPDVPIQVAHMGGGGSFDDSTAAVVDAFATAIDQQPDRMERVVFDLSGVPHPEYLAQGREELLERIRVINQRFMNAVNKLGADRIVFATDWPVVSMPEYLQGLRDSLPMSAQQFADLIDDPAPYLAVSQNTSAQF